MSRVKNAENLIKYLEDRVNCKNVIKFIEEGQNESLNKLVINNIFVAFEIINYHDRDTSEAHNKTWLNNIIKIYDFMTESNYTGFDYFPYLYGVLLCPNENTSKMYTFREYFDTDITVLTKSIIHNSEWYDIAFQIVMTVYYLRIVNGYNSEMQMDDFLFNKLQKPYHKDYILNETKVTINHKCLISFWNPEITKTENENKPDIKFLLDYLQEKKDDIIIPSPKINNFLESINNNLESTPKIISEFYTTK